MCHGLELAAGCQQHRHVVMGTGIADQGRSWEIWDWGCGRGGGAAVMRPLISCSHV